MKVLHAWYSIRMGKICGIFLYQKEDGGVIEGTIATPTKEHTCLWDDMVYLGEIVKCLGRKTDGEITKLDYDEPGIRKFFEILDREKKTDADPHRWN